MTDSRDKSPNQFTTPRPWRAVSAAATLLIVEILALTPLVEFHDEPLRTIANPTLCHAALVAAVVLLTATRPADGAEGRSATRALRRRAERWLWSLCHVVACVALFAYSYALSHLTEFTGPSWISGIIWIGLALSVAASAVAIFISYRDLVTWMWLSRKPILIATITGAAVALATPAARSTWHSVHPPATWIIGRLLSVYPGGEPVETVVHGQPVIGTPQLTLLVTRYCAEMESIVAFWLILIAVSIVRGTTWRRFATQLAAGTLTLYLVNAVRLYLLVVMGLWTSASVSVGLAHSRIGNLVMLAVTVGIIAGRWAKNGIIRSPGEG